MSRFEHHGLDLELAVAGTTHQQCLRRRDHAADGVDGELLHHAVDRRRQRLQLGLLLGLDQVLGQPAAFCSALASSSESVRRYSATAWRAAFRVIAATAASASL